MADEDPVDHVAALRALGVPEELADRAVADDRVALSLVQQVVDEPRPYSLEDLHEHSGVPVWVLRERYRALGFPEAMRYGATELDEAETLAELLQVIGPDALVRVLRIDGQALTRIAFAHLDLVIDEIVEPVRRVGGDDIAVALALLEAHQTLTPLAGDMIRQSYQRILSQLLSSDLVAEATRTGGDEADLAVGFADVVGYTSLSARVDPAGLEEVIEAFETRCYTVAGTLDGVQLVKFLGDAVMLVATSPVLLATALLAIVNRPDADGPLAGSPIRAGLAAGPVIHRGGDYFGPTVNLAARLTDRARAGRLLAAADLEGELGDLEIRRAPTMHLRGIGRHKPLNVRLPAPTSR
jgi:adenylate cyclase